MAGYLALARKYRSQAFDEVVGQEPISQTLTNAIRTGKIHHAYLFTGTRGVGKTTMARILAKALNCLSADEPTDRPCGQCEACVAISRGDDMDVVEIDGASNRGIEEIRELRANAIYRPSRCRYKVYYIDEVHMLTREAFNALLKTLEEPPEHVKFIFATTEAAKMPATILSRCQRFDFRNIPTRQIADHLASICQQESVPAEPDALFRVARAGAGSMRDALSLLDQILAGNAQVTVEEVVRTLGTPGEEQTLQIAAAIAGSDAADALGRFAAVLDSGVTINAAVGSLAEVFRNVMLAATCGAESELIELPETARKSLAELADRMSLPAIVQALAVLAGAERSLRGSSVGRALAEAAIVRLAEADKFVDPGSLADRLEALARAGRTGGASGPDQKKHAPLTGRTDGARPEAPRPSQSGGPVGQGQGPVPASRRPDMPPNQPPSRDDGQQAARPAAGPDPSELLSLSTEEKSQIHQDPAVRQVMDLFGGSVVHYQRRRGAPQPPSADPENDLDADSDESET